MRFLVSADEVQIAVTVQVGELHCHGVLRSLTKRNVRGCELAATPVPVDRDSKPTAQQIDITVAVDVAAGVDATRRQVREMLLAHVRDQPGLCSQARQDKTRHRET